MYCVYNASLVTHVEYSLKENHHELVTSDSVASYDIFNKVETTPSERPLCLFVEG